MIRSWIEIIFSKSSEYFFCLSTASIQQLSLNLDGIKKEAELSLNKVKEIPENTNEEMNEFVKNYNLRL